MWNFLVPHNATSQTYVCIISQLRIVCRSEIMSSALLSHLVPLQCEFLRLETVTLLLGSGLAFAYLYTSSQLTSSSQVRITIHNESLCTCTWCLCKPHLITCKALNEYVWHTDRYQGLPIWKLLCKSLPWRMCRSNTTSRKTSAQHGTPLYSTSQSDKSCFTNECA